ncbi:ABC transporter ATP-binding protein [Bacillus massilioanorexius]|uniref:ABC transporter ATP-binding protein n=1 Tax=Bacillus TaxID=1386 RepID=UPI000311541F
MKDKLILEHITKEFNDGNKTYPVLKDINLNVKAGEFVAIVGPSGSGKSTLLSIAGALLSPTSGKIQIGDAQIGNLTEQELNKIRLEKIGFIFQSANLIPYLTVRDQLLLIGELSSNQSKKVMAERADDLLAHLGLSHRKDQYPEKLSGGEKQRVAIARAMMNDPEIILADEPTASLDSERGREVVKMLSDEVKRSNKAAIMVTHDLRMLDVCDRVVHMEDGVLSELETIK